MLFLLICWITFTVNIYEACDSSNLEILHILEINHVVINYISALKIVSRIKHIYFQVALHTEMKKINTTC